MDEKQIKEMAKGMGQTVGAENYMWDTCKQFVATAKEATRLCGLDPMFMYHVLKTEGVMDALKDFEDKRPKKEPTQAEMNKLDTDGLAQRILGDTEIER